MRRRRLIGSTVRTSWPSTLMWPASASISRLASRKSVVLPEPEPPTTASNSPSATSSETSSTARTGAPPRPPAKLLPTWANAIRGGLGIERDLNSCLPGSGRAKHHLLPRPCSLRRELWSVLEAEVLKGYARSGFGRSCLAPGTGPVTLGCQTKDDREMSWFYVVRFWPQ